MAAGLKKKSEPILPKEMEFESMELDENIIQNNFFNQGLILRELNSFSPPEFDIHDGYSVKDRQIIDQVFITLAIYESNMQSKKFDIDSIKSLYKPLEF